MKCYDAWNNQQFLISGLYHRFAESANRAYAYRKAVIEMLTHALTCGVLR